MQAETTQITARHVAQPDSCYRAIEDCGQQRAKGVTWYCSLCCERAAQYGEPINVDDFLAAIDPVSGGAES